MQLLWGSPWRLNSFFISLSIETGNGQREGDGAAERKERSLNTGTPHTMHTCGQFIHYPTA